LIEHRTTAAHAALLALIFVALAAWSWGRWPDVLVDFGRELYVAWRLSEGDVLYRDVASFYGPLSPYVNALWFRLFGVSLRTLALCNMAVMALVAAGLYALVRRAGSRWGALAGATVFLAMFGFAHLVANGSFNFVAPYSHESTHGFALALGAILCALKVLDGGSRVASWAAACGLLNGLAFLTKPESFVAAAGASALLLAVARPPKQTLAVSGAGLIAPPAIAFALLSAVMPARDACTGVLGSWAFVGNEGLRGMWYFAWSMGVDDPGRSLAALARAALPQALLLGLAVALAWAGKKRPHLRKPRAIAAAALVLLVLAPAWRAGWWLQAARPLPLWTLLAVATSAWAIRRRRGQPDFPVHATRLAFAVFALLLLPRIVLNARLYHYGFVLALPATLVVWAALLDWIPQALDRRGADGSVFRAAALAALAVMLAFHVGESHARYRAKVYPVSAGADHFLADARGPFVAATLKGLAERAPVETLAVLPEGVMINYLSRRRTSIPYLTMLPSDAATFGEDELLGSLRRNPPALVALVHRDSSEMGAQFFGLDYGQRTMEWIHAHYEPIGGAGDPPLRPGSTFGVTVLRRRE
jgi:dolichyl-phosphate-mannose-protein mannosyltransferase